MLMLSTLPTENLAPSISEEIIKLRLLAWHQDGDVHFMYAPTPPVVFKTLSPVKKLLIEVIDGDENTTSPQPDFWITHYTTSKRSAIRSVKPEKRKSGGGYDPIQHPMPTPALQQSKIGDDTNNRAKRVMFEVNLNPGASFYLNVLIKHVSDPDRLISCDPQVENGTKP